MEITIWQRHYVKDDNSLKEFEDAVYSTINASKKRNYDYSIFLGYPSKFNGETEDNMMKQVDKLVEKDISVVLNKGYGPGTAWFGSMFNFSTLQNISVNRNPDHVNFLIDADQFSIDDSNVLDGVLLTAYDLIEKNTLMGLGSRNNVKLSDETELDNLRKIEEMHQAKFIGGKFKAKNPLDIDISDIPLSYKKYGDPISGFYALNTGHLSYLELFRNIFESCIYADLTGYAGDSYSVMRASQLVKEIPSIFVPVKGNPPGEFRKDTIKKKNIELGKTNIGRIYHRSIIHNKSFEKELSYYYPENQIKNVRKMIIEGLEEGLIGFDHKKITKN